MLYWMFTDVSGFNCFEEQILFKVQVVMLKRSSTHFPVFYLKKVESLGMTTCKKRSVFLFNISFLIDS